MWVNQNFIFPHDIALPDSSPNLTINIKSLRDGTDIVMFFEISGKSTIFTDNMFIAADLVQSLTGYLKLESLEVGAYCQLEVNYLLLEKKQFCLPLI